MGNSSLCLTPACLQAASTILWSLSPNWDQMDPCNEFEEMVCYGFRERNPDDTDTLTLLEEHNQRILRNILESPYEDAANNTAIVARDIFRRDSVDQENFMKLKADYESCLNVGAIEEAGLGPLAELIAEIDAIWPITDDGMNTTIGPNDYEPLSKAILYLTQLGVQTFGSINARVNPFHPELVSIFIDPPTIENVTQYTNNDTLNEYAKKIAAVFQAGIHPGNVSETLAETIAQGIVGFEVALISVYLEGFDITDLSKFYKVMTLGEASSLVPALGLDKVITSLAPADLTVDKVVVGLPEFLPNVSDIISATPKGILQSWMVWRAISSFGTEVQDVLIPFFNNIDPAKPRSQTCLKHVDQTLRFILARFYLSAAFSDRTQQFGHQMMNGIRSQFKTRIQALTWMTPETKQLAMQKVDDVKQYIGYQSSSPDVKDPSDLAEYYAALNISDDYFSNVLSYRRWDSQRQWNKLGKPVDEGELLDEFAPYSVNAYYQAIGNTIQILAGIMQLPIFSVDLPAYASYGALGSILGHELTHGFDNRGRLYDQSGAYATWWDANSTASFEAQAGCFVDQYNGYTVPTPGGTAAVSGEQTLAENIADAGGINVAYDAWKSMANDAADNKDLPGLEKFTPEELFYIFYANTWCSNLTPELNAEILLKNSHSPNTVRILGSMANSRGFKEVFNCPVKEPTCELW